MIKYLNILLLLLVINCMTFQSQVSKPEVKVSMKDGCHKYTGKDWDTCIVKLVKEFQDIYNAPVDKTVISEDRISEDYVSINTKYCIKSICFEEIREEYKPTIASLFKKNILYFLGGTATGIIIGVKVTGAILIF